MLAALKAKITELKSLNEQHEALSKAMQVNSLAAVHVKISPLLEALAVALEALEMYAKGEHFEFHGNDEFAPENPSGEPENIECGGAPLGEFTVENGGIASKALADAARILGEGK